MHRKRFVAFVRLDMEIISTQIFLISILPQIKFIPSTKLFLR